jgi:hypothetical protein
MRNDDEQHPDYSFGDLQRLSLLTPYNNDDTPTEQLSIDPKDPSRQSQQLPISKKFSSSSSKAHAANSKSISRLSKSPLGKSKSGSKKKTDLSQPQSKPIKVNYW